MEVLGYVEYKNNPCVLINNDGKTATIAGIYHYKNSFDCVVFEIDVPANEVSIIDPYLIERNTMIYRLRNYRMIREDIFGFMEEELSLVHYF